MPVWVWDRRHRYLTFVLLILSIHVTDAIMVRSTVDPGRRLIVAMAASLDVVLVVSALYYWMLIRPGIRSPGSLAVIALLGVLHATFFFPNAGIVRIAAAGVCEAALAGAVVFQIRKSQATRNAGENTDPVDAIRAAVKAAVPWPGAVKLISGELSILHYGLFSWRASPHIEPGTRAFSLYQQVGQAGLFGILPVACALELAPVHLLLNHWNRALAWTVTGISLYGMIWLIGLSRAFRLRPALIGCDYVYLRYGLLFQMRITREMIARVHPANQAGGISTVPRRSEPTVCIELTHAMDAEGLFGIRRRVVRIGLTPDDRPAFEQALAKLTGAGLAG